MSRETTDRARALRRNASAAERKLWSRLRGHRLQGFKFRRQVPICGYFADFACLSAKLIVEVDGGQHSEAEAYDAQRTQDLERMGFRVIRVWNHAVFHEIDGVMIRILRELGERARGAAPHPPTAAQWAPPSPNGRGDTAPYSDDGERWRDSVARLPPGPA